MTEPEQTQIDIQAATKLTEKFVALANDMKNEESNVEIINAALIAASATYSTYLAAGNDGYLNEEGIDKVALVYKQILTNIQNAKKGNIK